MSNHPRRKNRADTNQSAIVKALRSFPGMTVELNKDDFLCGYNGETLWVECKNHDCYSKKTGLLLESAKTKSQKALDKTWTGSRIYANCADDIFRWFGIKFNSR